MSSDAQFFWTIAVTIVGVLLTLVCAYYQREAVRIMLSPSMSAKKRTDLQQKLRWWWWPLVVMAFLAASAWIPYWLSSDEDMSVPKLHMVSYGGPVGIKFGDIDHLENVIVRADGKSFSGRTKSKYRVAAIAFHWYDPVVDKEDIEVLKSSIHEILDEEIPIPIPVNSKFKEELRQGMINKTNYALILVPKDVSIDKFTTMRQAKAFGVRVVGVGAGPP